jgi:NUDIX domain
VISTILVSQRRTVCLVREAGDRVDYLVLCDSPLVLDLGDQVDVVNDDQPGGVMSESNRHSVSVAAVVVDDEDQVLVVQRRDNGKWEIPGGILELGESIRAGVRREVEEETGLLVEPERLTGRLQEHEARRGSPRLPRADGGRHRWANRRERGS